MTVGKITSVVWHHKLIVGCATILAVCAAECLALLGQRESPVTRRISYSARMPAAVALALSSLTAVTMMLFKLLVSSVRLERPTTLLLNVGAIPVAVPSVVITV